MGCGINEISRVVLISHRIHTILRVIVLTMSAWIHDIGQRRAQLPRLLVTFTLQNCNVNVTLTTVLLFYYGNYSACSSFALGQVPGSTLFSYSIGYIFLYASSLCAKTLCSGEK